jgi:hypothetical protein
MKSWRILIDIKYEVITEWWYNNITFVENPPLYVIKGLNAIGSGPGVNTNVYSN